MLALLTSLLALCLNPPSAIAAAPSGPWDAFNNAPEQRTVSPVSVIGGKGFKQNQSARGIDVTLSGNSSSFILDWGKEIGGLLSFSYNITTATDAGASLLLSFTESPLFIRPFASDDSIIGEPNTTYDGVLSIPFTSLSSGTPGFWSMPKARLRGGFRYLTITLDSLTQNSAVAIDVSNITTQLTFSTHMSSLRSYGGYFYAKDPNPPKWSFPGAFNSSIQLPPGSPGAPVQAPKNGDPDFLTKLWYAGAYTLQTTLVPLDTGRAEQPHAPAGTWFNNGTLGILWTQLTPPPPNPPTDVPDVTIVDGAKRDRAVWPGDLFHALPTLFLSLPPSDSLPPTMNALATMFAFLNPQTGAFPESGPPLLQLGSDTYHMWTLVGVYNTYLFSGDTTWLQNLWSNYTFAVSFITNKTDPQTGILSVTGLRDWARAGQGGRNTEANAIYYKLLTVAAQLASWLNDTASVEKYTTLAQGLKTSFNNIFWDDAVGLYKDNDTAAGALVHPQDANSMALLFDLADGKEETISQNLVKNWGTYGPITPELTDCVSPFVSGFELLAHFTACAPGIASRLIHTLWGYMLYTPLSVGGSTLIEGLTSNGSIAYRWNDGYGNDPSYTSHAHGWSTAPTSIFIQYVLGLKFVQPAGTEWTLIPFLFGLNSAEGGFEGVGGWYGVQWELQSTGTRGGTSATLTITLSTPPTSKGTLTIPSCNGVVSSNGITVDGKQPRSHSSSSSSSSSSSTGNGGIEIPGGEREIIVKFDSIAPLSA